MDESTFLSIKTTPDGLVIDGNFRDRANREMVTMTLGESFADSPNSKLCDLASLFVFTVTIMVANMNRDCADTLLAHMMETSDEIRNKLLKENNE